VALLGSRSGFSIAARSFTQHIGRRGATAPEAPNDDTVYYIASLTKAITAAAIAILVDQGRIPRLSRYLAEFKHRQDDIKEATLVDVLSHRTGMTGGNAL
jgi:CubicO group peptidase (beta-lactamase class C family)